jgi:solute carrier family 25 (mitochondrial phosphate transporter), member 23/24/25/41
MSDQAISGAGETYLDFLQTAMFGAILQLVRPPRARASLPPSREPIEEGLEEETDITRPDLTSHTKPIDDYHLFEEEMTEEDPHIPLKPARRKHTSEEQEPLKLTDFVPDVGYFIAGGLSGITSRTATAPLDRLKVYLIAQTGVAQDALSAAKSGAAVQATKQGMRTLVNACQELWAAGGIRSLFAGESSSHVFRLRLKTQC